MATAIVHPITSEEVISPWQGFKTGLWQKEINVRDFIQQNYQPYEGDESFLAPATERTQESVESAQRTVRRRAEEGRARRLPDSEFHHRSRPGLHRSRERNHRRSPDRGAAQARHHAERRLPHGRECAQDLRIRTRSACGRSVHQVPQDAQRRGLRCLHRRHPAVSQLARSDRTA